MLYYLYGIVASKDAPSSIGLGGLSVVYERVPEHEFGQEAIHVNLKKMDWVNQKVLDHQTKLEEIAAQTSVVPLKFGSIFKTEDSILKMLSERKEEFESLLNKFEKKQEWGVKLFYQTPLLDTWLLANEASLKTLQDQINQTSGGGAFLLKKQKEEQLKRSTKVILNEERKKVYEYLSSLTLDIHLNKEMEQGLTGRKDHNFFNASLLLPEEGIDNLKAFRESLLTSFSSMGIAMELSGPWPPYSFVTNG